MGVLTSPQVAVSLGPGISNSLFLSIDNEAPLSPGPLMPAVLPAMPQTSVVLLSGPSQLVACIPYFVVSAVSSEALSPFVPAPTWSWSASPTTAAISAAIVAVGEGNVLNVTSLDLSPGVEYAITATYARVSTATHVISLAPSPRVAVAITSPSGNRINSWAPLTLSATVTRCAADEPAGAVYSYAWTQLSGPNINLDRATQVTNVYSLPPNSLMPGTYEFQVAVDLNDNLSLTGRGSTTIVVVESPLVALPSGQLVATRLRDVTLDGALSQDPDRSTATVSYAWDCHEDAQPDRPCVVSSLLAPAPALLSFPTANLAPGAWDFSLIVSKGSKKARAFQTVSVDWDESPSGNLQISDPAKTQFISVGSPASATRLVNARQPLVLFVANVEVESRIVAWNWRVNVPSDSLAASLVAAKDSSYLFLSADTLIPGAGYVFEARATDTHNQTSSFTISVTANTVPRVMSGGCSFSPAVPAAISTLYSELTVVCQGFGDDGAHYPLSYLFSTAEGFHLTPDYLSTSQFSFVIPEPQTTGVLINVRNALGAWSSVRLPFPSGTVVSSSFPSDVAGIAAASVTASVALKSAVELGLVERIEQLGQGVLWGVTQAIATDADAASVDVMRQSWLFAALSLDKYAVTQPSLLWSEGEGRKLTTWTQSASLLSPVLQNVTVFTATRSFDLQLPLTATAAQEWTPVLSQLLVAMDFHPIDFNVSRAASLGWYDLTVALLGAQISGGAAVPEGTRLARYSAPQLTVWARHDVFQPTASFVGPDVTAFSVSFADRVHNASLNAAAQTAISRSGESSHGVESFATPTDVFRWASRPPLQLASDVVMFRFSRPSNNSELSLGSDGLIELDIELTPTLLTPPVNCTTSLLCISWESSIELWQTDACETRPMVGNESRVACSCSRGGVFAAAWVPVIADGLPMTPLLPYGPSQGIVTAWLPIAVALILAAFLAALLLLFCCLRRKAPARSPPLLPAGGTVDPDMDPLDDWSAHLDRPVRYHQPSTMPPGAPVVYFEPTSSGEDDWPSHDLPNPARTTAPLLPRTARQPFIGGRVALVRDGNAPADADAILVAPRGHPIEQVALPSSASEQRRFDQQLGRERDSREDFSSEDAKRK